MKCTTIWTYKRHLVDSHRKVAHPSIFGWKWRSSKGLNSSLPRAAYMCHWNGSALAQIMACCLFGVKPLPEPTLGLLSIGSSGTNFSEILIKIQKFPFTKNASEKIVSEMAAILSRGGELIVPQTMDLNSCINHHWVMRHSHQPYYIYGRFWSVIRADSRFAPSQWETPLQSNAVSHWLSASLESALCSASNGRSPTRSMRIELAVSELEINVRRSMCELENMGIGRIGSLKQSLKPKIRCVYTKTNPCYRPANGLVPDMASILCMFSVRTPADSTDGDREFPQYIVFYRRG